MAAIFLANAQFVASRSAEPIERARRTIEYVVERAAAT
jgi:hypothetical protein